MASTTITSSSEERKRGNEYFSAQKFEEAVIAYTKSIELALSANAAPAQVKKLCSNEPMDPDDIFHVIASGSTKHASSADEAASLADALRKEIVACLGNRSQCYLKLSSPTKALRDCSVCLALDSANVKALYRRALCYEATGRIREALVDASHALQVDTKNVAAADLLRKLRETAASRTTLGAGATQQQQQASGSSSSNGSTLTSIVPSGGKGGSTKSNVSSFSSPSSSMMVGLLDLTDCLLLLRRARDSNNDNNNNSHTPNASENTATESIPSPASPSTLSSPSSSSSSPPPPPQQQQQLTGPELERCVRSLQALLVASSPIRAFLGDDGPRSLLKAALNPNSSIIVSGGEGSENTSSASSTSSTTNVVTPACNILISVCAKIVDEYAGTWHREWDNERRSKSLALADIVPAQQILIDSLAAAVTHPQASLSLAKGGTGAAAPTAAAVRLSVALLAAAFAILRPQLQAQTLERIRQWKAIKDGTLATTAPLPVSLRQGIKQWSAVVGGILSSVGPVMEGSSSVGLIQACLSGVAHLCDGEESVNLLDRAGILSSISIFAASEISSLRRSAMSALSRALEVLRVCHPRGHAEMGRTKLKGVLTRALGICISDLAVALPFKPEEEGEKGKDRKADSSSSFSGSSDILYTVPSTLPNWTPRVETTRATALLQVALLVDRDTGLWLADQPGVLPAIFITCASHENAPQELGADVIAAICSDETGRSLLNTLPQRIISGDPSFSARLDVMQLLLRLTFSLSPSVKASAAVTLTKLTAPSKAFSSADGKAGRDEVVGSVLALLKAATGQMVEDDDDDDDDEGDDQGGSKKKVASSSAAAFKSKPNTPSFKQLVNAVKAGWGTGAVGSGINSLLGGTFGTSSTSSASGNSSANAKNNKSTATAKKDELVVAVDLEGATRAIEALAVIATHTTTKARLVEEECIAPLMSIGASLVAYSELQRAMILASRGDGTADATSDVYEIRSGNGPSSSSSSSSNRTTSSMNRVMVGKHGGMIDLSKINETALSTVSKAQLRPSLYGLAHILYSLITSRQRQQEAKLAELEVDIEQWKELQRLAAPPGTDPQAGQEIDPPAEVEARARILVQQSDVLHLIEGIADAARGLPMTTDEEGSSSSTSGNSSRSSSSSSFSNNKSKQQADLPLAKETPEDKPLPPPVPNNARNGAATREVLSLFLLQVSEWIWARGIMVQGGALSLLLDLSVEGQGVPIQGAGNVSAAIAASGAVAPLNTLQGALAASQAMARIFITTNPNLIPQAYLHDAIRPLLRLARDGTTSLSQFEAGLALTNIGGCGPDAREALLQRRALSSMEYLQFSNHKLVRRCGTEALTNMATCDDGARLILWSRLGLWLALARSFQAPGAHIANGSEPTSSSSSAAAAAKKKKKMQQQQKQKAAEEAASTSSNAAAIVVAGAGAAASSASGAGAGNAAGDEVTDDDDDDDATEKNENSVFEEEDRDTPTAMAAAGALAMACMHVMKDIGSEEEAKKAENYAHRLVRGGTVLAMAELLLSGHDGLMHRAAVVLSSLAQYPIGAAALLTPLGVLDDASNNNNNNNSSSSGEEDESEESSSPFAESMKGLNVFLLLHLLGEGKDISSMAAARGSDTSTTSTSTSTSTAAVVAKGKKKEEEKEKESKKNKTQTQQQQETKKKSSLENNDAPPPPPPVGGVPLPVVLLSRGAVKETLKHGSTALLEVSTDYGKQAAAIVPVPESGSGSSSSGEEEDATWKLAKLAPVWPSDEIIATTELWGEEDE